MSFDEEQIKALKAKLSAKHIRTREHAGRTLSYIEGWKAISEANRIFGFDGWDRETIELKCVWSNFKQGLCSCTYAAKVCVRIRAGDRTVVREGNGCGHGLGATAGEAHEGAIKQAETDAMKRAFATFGNPFGLALYDSEQNNITWRGTKRDNEDRQLSTWQVVSALDEVISVQKEPLDYCSELRKFIDSFRSAGDLEAFWARNQNTLKALRNSAPQLINDKGEHFVKILDTLYRQKVKELKENQKLELTKVNGSGSLTPESHYLGSQKIRRVRDREHLKYVASLPCLICDRSPSQAHHILFAQPRAVGRKVSDEWVVPLCVAHHRSLHNDGNEESWWRTHGIDPIEIAERLWHENLNK